MKYFLTTATTCIKSVLSRKNKDGLTIFLIAFTTRPFHFFYKD